MFGCLDFGNRRSKTVSSDIIQRLSKGDTDVIEELFDCYFDRTYCMVYNQVGRNHESAEEVVQETCVAAVKSARKFKGKSSPYTWICGIAAPKIMAYQRRSCRDNAKELKPSNNPEIPELQLIDSSPLPDELVERDETKGVVRRTLDSLPGHYKQVLALKYIEEMSTKEIGQIIGESTKSVESLLNRAKLALRNEILTVSS